MNYTLNGKRIRKIGYYAPGLGTTLISIKQHIKYQGCYFHAENDTVLLAYLKVVLYATTDPEFLLTIKPSKQSILPSAFNKVDAIFTAIADKRQL